MADNPLTLLHSDPASRPAREVLEELGTSRERGLEPAEAQRRLQRYGPNVLREWRPRGWSVVLLDQLVAPATALLAGAAILSFGFGEEAEALAIAAVLLLRTAVGFFTELGAARSMRTFFRFKQTTSRVRRGGEVREVYAGDLVPGDVVLLAAGDVAPADLRLLFASGLQTDESVLTGVPEPVDKSPEPKWPGAPLQERTSMVFGGTEIVRGNGEAVVVETGVETELGRTPAADDDPVGEQAPFRERLGRLGGSLTRLALLVAVLVAALGLLSGEGLLLAVQLSVALFVAVVPENLAAVANLSLGRGMLGMLRRGILVNRPRAIEGLGSTDLLWTAEAGVLTEGRMSAVRACLESGETPVGGPLSRSEEDRILRELLEIGVLCNDAAAEDAGKGDPVEVALLETAAAAGLDRDALVRSAIRVRTTLGSGTGLKATYHKAGEDVYLVSVKGAPTDVLDLCTRVRTVGGEEFMRGSEREWWDERNERLAEEGLRVAALAAKEAASAGEEPFEDLTLLGLVGFEDPIRGDTEEAVERCRSDGIRVLVASADRPGTARSIARSAGLAEGAADVVWGGALLPPDGMDEGDRRRVAGADVFAGLSPEQAERVISAHRRDGSVVTVADTGRYVPALAAADVGIAAGERGARVARSVADVVLKDAAFSAVVDAIWQARNVFANIIRYSTYRISCGVAVILVAAIALLAGLPLPILPLQVLLLSLLTHVLPALALGVGDPASNRPLAPGPRGLGWLDVVAYAGFMAVPALAAFTVALLWSGVPGEQVVTVSFLTLAFAQLWHVPNTRAPRTGLLDNDVVRNPYVWAALAVCAASLVGAVYLPALAALLDLEPPGLSGWVLVLGLSPLPLILGEVYRRLARRTL